MGDRRFVVRFISKKGWFGWLFFVTIAIWFIPRRPDYGGFSHSVFFSISQSIMYTYDLDNLFMWDSVVFTDICLG